MAITRQKNIFDPKSKSPFKLSRSKLEMFHECPRCFYLDRRLGVGRPSIPGYTLNSAVDYLLKKEFDIHRKKQSTHPLMKTYGIEAVPFQHQDIDVWRENFVGVQYLHQKSNFLIFGAVDDIWLGKDGRLMVVDYKATSTEKQISLDDYYKQGYKRQMEIYQWLLRQNGHDVANQGYFVYVNGRKDLAAFDGRLEFEVQIIPYKGDDSWVEKLILAARRCLVSKKIPSANKKCEYCQYRAAAAKWKC